MTDREKAGLLGHVRTVRHGRGVPPHLTVEWFNPATGGVVASAPVAAGSRAQTFTPPFSGDAVLLLKDTTLAVSTDEAGALLSLIFGCFQRGERSGSVLLCRCVVRVQFERLFELAQRTREIAANR